MFYHVLLYSYCFAHLLTHFQNYESYLKNCLSLGDVPD